MRRATVRTDYAPLRRHLSALESQEWSTSFPEVERILRGGLPDSARKHRPWWANHAGNTQGRVWLDAGWKVERVNLRAETVMFRRTLASTPRRNALASRPSREIDQPLSSNQKASSKRADRPSFWRKLWQDISGVDEATPPSVIPAKAGIQRAGEVSQPIPLARKKTTSKSRLPLDIHTLLESLSRSRPIFHSEADFQHALAWKIHEIMPDSQIRLEYPFRHDGNPMYLDIWLPTERMAIELKYLTRRLEQDYEGERFALKDQSAHDVRRYDFLKDVQRLESVVEHTEQPTRGGVAVLLTNDSAYSKSPTSRWETNNDAAFRLHEDRKATGNLVWSERTGQGTMKGREDPIRLSGSYSMHWRDYSRLGEGNNQQFRYLAVAVQ